MSLDKPEQILESLRCLDWDVLSHTYGNSHASLVGLVGSWWLRQDGSACRSVADGSPGFPDGTGGRPKHPDLLLCEDEQVVGLVECEGTHYCKTIGKLLGILGQRHCVLRSVRFVLLVLYATQGRTRKKKRKWRVRDCQMPAIDALCRKLSGSLPVIVASVGKKRLHEKLPPFRDMTDYHKGDLTEVTGRLWLGGRLEASTKLWKSGQATATDEGEGT